MCRHPLSRVNVLIRGAGTIAFRSALGGSRWITIHRACHAETFFVGREKVIHIDALRLHGKYSDVFSMDDVPEEERKAVARQVADRIVVGLADRRG